jgi:hypothetical protein
MEKPGRQFLKRESIWRIRASHVKSAQPPRALPLPEDDVSKSFWREGLFEDFSSLVEIEICSSRATVPENNKLLRCFQYIRMDSVSVGDYCWNGDCTNCQVWYRAESGAIKSALACRMYVRPGLVITDMSPSLKMDLTRAED